MRVLIYARHYPVASGRYMRDAFRRIGVDVRSVGPEKGMKIWGAELPMERQWIPDGSADLAWRDWRPDVVLIMDLMPFHHPQYHDVPHLVYAVDNHVHNFRQAGVVHYFLGHLRGAAMPVGPSDTTWLPCGYDPTFCTPSAVPWEQREFDVALIGVIYQQRRLVLDAVGKIPGIKIAAGAGAVYEDFRDIYHNARISLNVSARGDVAIRIFETAAMGCAIVTDPLDDLLDLQADGIVAYETVEAAVERVRTLLAEPQSARALAARSQQWARPHTWDARAVFIRDWCLKNFAISG